MLKEEPGEGGQWQTWWSPRASDMSHKSGMAPSLPPTLTRTSLAGLLFLVELCPPEDMRKS